MKKHYNLVYLTNTPSFYKVNLCERIAESCSLLLVCYGYGDEAVNSVLENKQYKFDYFFLSDGDANNRNKLNVFFRLCKLLYKFSYDKLLYSGWFVPEYDIYSFISPIRKNVVICESSLYDVSFGGIKGWLKKKILNRMSAALPSGEPHAALFRAINFKRTVNITGGVGIFNKGLRIRESGIEKKQLRYIYVGRLVEAKNLHFLIKVFNKLNIPLSIVGAGKQEKELRELACSNIRFMGFIPNENLGNLYMEHDVFVLPSISEPWGLVVDEAIYWGLPVLVSSNVGSAIDLVINPKNGCVFDPRNEDSLKKAILEMGINYEQYKANVDSFDFDERDRKQVMAYTSLL